jgi:hypothetical protein
VDGEAQKNSSGHGIGADAPSSQNWPKVHFKVSLAKIEPTPPGQ